LRARVQEIEPRLSLIFRSAHAPGDVAVPPHLPCATRRHEHVSRDDTQLETWSSHRIVQRRRVWEGAHLERIANFRHVLAAPIASVERGLRRTLDGPLANLPVLALGRQRRDRVRIVELEARHRAGYPERRRLIG